MSEQKLKHAFEQMGPDNQTRQRILKNILAAHEAAGVEAKQPAHVEKQTQRNIREFSLIRYALPFAACLALALAVFPVFSLLSNAIGENTSEPSAPPAFSNPSPPGTEPGNTAPGNSQGNSSGDRVNGPSPSLGTDFTPGEATHTATPGTNTVGNGPDVPDPSAKPSWPSGVIDFIPLALALLACLAAGIIAARGIAAWKREKQK